MRNPKDARNRLQQRLIYTDTHTPFTSAGGHVGVGKGSANVPGTCPRLPQLRGVVPRRGLGAKATEVCPGSGECSLFSRQRWLPCLTRAARSGRPRGPGGSDALAQELREQQIRPLPAGPPLPLALLLSVRGPERRQPPAGWPQPRHPNKPYRCCLWRRSRERPSRPRGTPSLLPPVPPVAAPTGARSHARLSLRDQEREERKGHMRTQQKAAGYKPGREV
ncbi:uncharacterized protein [Equus przewalskii]|uniref:Uncharacterized protein n=1 Tax=Equus przewalskii TaxID=9798 RepID=A0ABM4NB30_EQUPR|nr:uncharacterized protein LOC102149305 [Equus caballus]